MKCPRDEATLAKQTLAGGVEIDACTLCGGTWLDKGELETLQRMHSHDHDGKLIPAQDRVALAFEVAKQKLEPHLDCPVCGTTMARHEYAWTSQVVIDECPAGCGMWLDKGELEELELFFEREHANADDPVDTRSLLAAMFARIKVI
jgi:Zn-finger nucleic acid-binding protein